MVFVVWLLVLFFSVDSWAAASKSLALYEATGVETKRQKEIREQFFPGENQRRADPYLEVTGLPLDMLDLVRGYLRDDREFWVASVQSQEVAEEGAINVFTVGTRQAPYTVFQMADYSLKVKKVTADGAEPIATLVGHAAPITCVAISPDGRYLCAAAEDKYFKVWDLQTGECKRTQQDGWVLRNVEFFIKGNALYLMTYNGVANGLRTYIPLGDEPAFGLRALAADDIPAFYGFENLSKGEVIFTMQDLGAGKSFVLSEQHCLVYDRMRWKLQYTHPSLEALPRDIVAGRISETHKNTLFILTKNALYTYDFDYTKQEYVKERSIRPIKKIQFTFPAHVMLSDDGCFCAGITKNYFDLWDLVHETRLYHIPLTGDKTIQVNKLFFSPKAHYVSIVNDATKRVTCHFFDTEIAQHLYSLTLADSELIKGITEKSDREGVWPTELDEQEYSKFLTLPACVRENLVKIYRIRPASELTRDQRRVVDVFRAKPRTVPPQKVKLTDDCGMKLFATLPQSWRDLIEKNYDIYRPWPWWKKTATAVVSLVALDFFASRLVTQKPMVLQQAWQSLVNAAATSKKVLPS